MNHSVDRRQFLTGITAASVLLSACDTAGAARPARPRKRHGGDLKAGLTGGSSSDTLDPHQIVTYIDGARVLSVCEPLVQLSDTATTIEYVLAEQMTPRTTDATQWIIRLRPGITFHDGKPLTAADVVYTFQRILTNHYSASVVLGPVDAAGIKALDTRTVLMPMSRPFATLDQQLASIFSAAIVPEGFDPKKPSGTGPFKYQSFTAGQQSVFTRNPDYWQQPLPYADSLTIIDFPDTTSLTNALVTGQVHAAGTLDGPAMTSLANAKGVHTLPSRAGAFEPFTMRVDQKPFDDPQVRQAMRLLVNRPQLIDSALDGYGTIANDLFSPYDPDYDHALPQREQDIDQARYLLKKAGHEGLTVTLTTSAIATASVAMATVLAEQAKAAGVTIHLSNVTSGTFFATGKYLQWPFAQDYYFCSTYLAQDGQSMQPASPWNETHFHDPAYIKLYNQANATTRPELRREIVRDMQQIDYDQGGYIIPAFTDTLDAYSDKITGYAPARVGKPLNYDFARLAFTA